MGELKFVLTKYGAPFSPAGFTSWFVQIAVKASIFGRMLNGLREADERHLAEAGCMAHQLMAIPLRQRLWRG